MAFFKRFFNKRLEGLQFESKRTKQHHLGTNEEEESSDEEVGPLSCPQIKNCPRRGGLDGGVVEPRLHDPMRRSRTWGGQEDFASGINAAVMARLSTSSSDYSPNDKLRAGYKKVGRSHRGRNATILGAVERATGRPVAIKVFLKHTTTSVKLDRMQREMAVLRLTSGLPGVVRLLDVLEDNTSYYTILEAQPGCSLIELMANRGGRLSERQCAREVAFPLLTALVGLHDLGVVHRDIKPEHVLCSHGSICLLDFVECALKSEKNLNHRAGQLEYCAPEVLDKPLLADIFHKVLYNGMSEEELPQYDEKVDLWSVGVLLYEALTGLQPFLADTIAELTEKHVEQLSQKDASGMPLFLANQNMPPLAQQFLAALLQLNPSDRPSAHEMLRHPWLQSHVSTPNNDFLLSTAAKPVGDGVGSCLSRG